MQQTKLVHRRNIIQQRALSSNPQSPRITARAKYTRALLVGATGYRRFPHGELPNGTLLYIFLFLSGRGGAHSNAKGPPSLHLRSLHWGWVFVCLMFFGPNIAWPKSPRFGSLTRAVLRFLVNIVIPILFSSTSRVWFHSTYRGGNSRKKKNTLLWNWLLPCGLFVDSHRFSSLHSFGGSPNPFKMELGWIIMYYDNYNHHFHPSTPSICHDVLLFLVDCSTHSDIDQLLSLIRCYKHSPL